MIVDNDQELLRCFKLGVGVDKLVIGGKRDATKVANVLQTINDYTDFNQRLQIPEVVDTSKLQEQLVLWHQLDRRFFPDHVRGNYDGLRLPDAPAGFGWTVVDVPGVTENVIVDRMRKEFPVYTYVDDLDVDVRSDRIAVSAPYVVRFRDRVEADEELQGKSAETLATEQIFCNTLRQRLRLELFYWAQTGQHLDLENVNLCPGSRYSDGDVPSVHWRDGRLVVHWCDPQFAFPHLRGRAAVV